MTGSGKDIESPNSRTGCGVQDVARKAIDWLEKRRLSESKTAGKSRMYRALWQRTGRTRAAADANAERGRRGEEEQDEGEEEAPEPTPVAERETIRFTVSPGRKGKPIDLPNGRLIPG